MALTISAEIARITELRAKSKLFSHRGRGYNVVLADTTK
jgi:hypothetical protein